MLPGSIGDWEVPCTVWAGIEVDPCRDIAGTWNCFCWTDSAWSNWPAVPVATTSTLSAYTWVLMPNFAR